MEPNYMKNVTEKVMIQIAHKRGFINPRLEFSAAATKGDSMISQAVRCIITDYDSKQKLHLIVKLPHADEQQRKAVRVETYFSKEAHMYKTVLPALADCYKKKNVLSKDAVFPCTARTYAFLDEGQDRLIVMEDLKQRGFVMKNRRVGLNEEDCRFVLRELARIHAASLALQKDNPKLHESLTEKLPENLLGHKRLPENFKRDIEKFRVAIDGHFPVGSPTRNKVEAFLANYHSNMKKILGKNNTLCCITHGDLHSNNILFKHKEGTNTVEEICFLDLQLSRYCSPITDIWFFLALCTTRSTRKSYKVLIASYYGGLCSSLRDLGHRPEDIVPWKLFQEELQKYGVFGWAVAIIILPMILAEDRDADILHKIIKGDTSVHLNLPEQAKAWFLDLIQEAEERGYFWDYGKSHL